jgi:hypothetical protein
MGKERVQFFNILLAQFRFGRLDGFKYLLLKYVHFKVGFGFLS